MEFFIKIVFILLINLSYCSDVPTVSYTRDLFLSFTQQQRCDGINFCQVSLKGLDLSGIDLSGIRFIEVDLTDANLAGAILYGALFENCALDKANLTGCNMYECIIRNSGLTDARLQKARLRNTIIENSDLSKVDFSLATAVYSFFYEVQCNHAIFNQAYLDENKFLHTTFLEASFVQASVQNCISDYLTLTKEQIAQGYFYKNTTDYNNN